jgi:hypothetical protein
VKNNTDITNNHAVLSSEKERCQTIQQMPDYARVWVYQSNRALSDGEIKEIENAGYTFIADWTAHGASLKASFDVLYKRFVIIAVDEQQALASGCSIDKSVHFIKQLEQQFNLNLFDRMQVAYRVGEEIKTCHVNDLLKELTNNGISRLEEVIVFNNMVATKKEFDKTWEVPLKDSWQSRILNNTK